MNQTMQFTQLMPSCFRIKYITEYFNERIITSAAVNKIEDYDVKISAVIVLTTINLDRKTFQIYNLSIFGENRSVA